MVLKPLEFTDCLSDSPWFRENLRKHEESLENATKKIKQIEQHCRKLISCFAKLSNAEKAFSSAIMEFKIDTVGSTQTDDERVIANSVMEFGHLIQQIEVHRAKVIDEAEQHYLQPLQNLAERINKVIRDEKHKYNKESNRFYTGLEKHLHLSTVRKNDFREADLQLGVQQKAFCQASLQYVAEIQAVQERVKFEFVETLSSFFYRWLSFYHVGHVIYEDFRELYDAISAKVQKARENFETTQTEAQELKHKMLATHVKNGVFATSSSSSDAPIRLANSNIKQGYVFVQEKSILSKTISRDVLPRNWTKYYCVYSKETRIFTMIPVNNSGKTNMKGTLEQSVSFKLKSCVRRASDSIDKRFCFDVIPEERSEVFTIQALSEEDRRQWLDSMDGREPVYSPGVGPQPVGSFDTMLDENGFDFVCQCLKAIEEHGICEQGIYRNCGVTSKVQRLMQLALDKRKCTLEKLNLLDDSEWETKTISSAIKTFLRNLPEPLMTFDLHNHFINAAKMHDAVQRVNHIHYYVYKLPETHFRMLELIIRHLRLIADHSAENLMTVGNLGVCFGPTLLRPKEETMAAIMDIKFCNVVVEVLISNCYQIFNTKPPQQIGLPCPPKPSHNLVAVMPPVNEMTNLSITTSSSSNIPDSLSSNQKSSSAEYFSNTETLPRSSATPPATRTAAFSREAGSVGSGSSGEHAKPPLQRQPPPPPPPAAAVVRQRKIPTPAQSSTLPRGATTASAENFSAAEGLRTAGINEPISVSTYNILSTGQPSVVSDSTTAVTSSSLTGSSVGSAVHGSGVAPLANSGSCADSLNSTDSTSSLVVQPSQQSQTQPIQFQLYQSTSQTASQQQQQQSGGGLTISTVTKAKTSYAPAYNPYACDKLQKRHSGGNLLVSSSAHSNLSHASSGLSPHGVSSASTSTLDSGVVSTRGGSTKQQRIYATPSTTITDSPHYYASLHQVQSMMTDASSSSAGGSYAASGNDSSLAYSTRIPQAYSNFINPNVQLQPSRRVRTLYSCTAGHDTELSFEPGQIITNVYESKEDGWLVGTLNGKTGLIPANYVEHILGP